MTSCIPCRLSYDVSLPCFGVGVSALDDTISSFFFLFLFFFFLFFKKNPRCPGFAFSLLAIGQAVPEQYSWPACPWRIMMGLDFFSFMSYPGTFFSLSMAYGVLAFMDIFACLLEALFHVLGGCCTPTFLLHSNHHSAICSVLKAVVVP